jgi:hypothetical protein
MALAFVYSSFHNRWMLGLFGDLSIAVRIGWGKVNSGLSVVILLRLFGGKVNTTIWLFRLVVITPSSVVGGGVGSKKVLLWNLLGEDFYLALLKYRIVVVNKELSKL